MFGIIKSAFFSVLSWLIKGATIKFVILSAIYFVITWIIESVLPSIDISPLAGLQALVNTLPSGLVYFLGVFRVDVGLPMLLGAMLTAFIIRRLPIIG
jgi:hypothetical protein